MFYDDDFKVYTDSEEVLDLMADLNDLVCRVCLEQTGKRVRFDTMKKLSNHLSNVHRLYYWYVYRVENFG